MLLARRNFPAQEVEIMPTYILLSSLTPEGSQTLHKDPDRLDAVNKEISEAADDH